MIDCPYLPGGEQFPGGVIPGEGVRVPAVPQARGHLQVLLSAGVAPIVVGQRGKAEVVRRAFQGTRHDVPADPAAGDLVEGGELASHVEGMGERR
jgi:hypothetical protein